MISTRSLSTLLTVSPWSNHRKPRCRFIALLLLFLLATGCTASKDGENAQHGSTSVDDSERRESSRESPTAHLPRGDQTQSSAAQSDQRLLEEARAALSEGTPETAAEKARAYLLAHPRDARGLFLAAQIEAACQRYVSAVALLDEIPRDHPQAGLAALGQSADWMLAAERWDESERRYKAVLERAPSANTPHRRLAYLLNRQGRRQEASVHVRFLCRAGDVLQSELHTLLDEGEAIHDKEHDADSSTSRFAPIGPHAEARVLYSQKQFKLALDRLREPMSAGSLRPSGRAFFGRLATEVDDQHAIAIWIEQLDEAQQAFSDHWIAQSTLMLREATDIEGAARALCEAIVRNPTDWIAMSRLENSLNTMHEVDQAKACRDRATALRKTLRINLRIIGSSDPKLTDIAELANLLDQLHRPFEALMWRAIGLGYQNAPQQAFDRLESNRNQLIRDVPNSMRPSDALAGLSLTKYPLAREFSSQRAARVRARAPKTIRAASTTSGTPLFPNIAKSVGLDFHYSNASQPKLADLQLYEQFGGGVAAIDYDLDGRVDLYFVQGGDDPKAATRGNPNALFRNVGGKFAAILNSDANSDDDRFGQGVTSGDWNQDGFPDFVIANFSVNTLLINNGDGTFRQAQMGATWMKPFWTTSVALADVSGDGLPDIVEVNYVDDPAVHVVSPRDADGRFTQSRGPESFRAAVDRVFVNRGDGSTQAVRLVDADQNDTGHGLGVVVTDVDGTAGNEIFVSNDTDANQLWSRVENNPDQPIRFTNLARVRGCAYSAQAMSGASMGIATGDFDRNGMIDFHVTNFYNEPAHLYLQTRKNMFNDSAIKSDLYQPSLNVTGFGTQALDYDNNGTLDLAVVNGHIDDFRFKGVPHKMLPQLFSGSEGRFVESEVEGSSDYWNRTALGRGLIKLDWNGDGRMDLVATHHDAPAALLENQTPSKNHWIQLRLVGTTSERDAIGARVSVVVSGQSLVDVVTSGDGYVCKNESIVAFGLGPRDRIDLLKVRWPSGKTQEFDLPDVDRRYLVVENSSLVTPYVLK